MPKPAQIEIVRLAYQLWQHSGEPEGRDEEFYLEAERKLQGQSSSAETTGSAITPNIIGDGLEKGCQSRDSNTESRT
jgi:hypothetical protein